MSSLRPPAPRPSRKSCRVYVVQHENGCYTAILMRQWNVFFDRPPPSAYGQNLDEVLEALDVELAQRAAAGDDPLGRYLWSETFQMRAVTIAVREASPLQQVAYRWALSVGQQVAERVVQGQPVPSWLKTKFMLGRWLAKGLV